MATATITDDAIEKAIDCIHAQSPAVAKQAEDDYYNASDESTRIRVGQQIMTAAVALQQRTAQPERTIREPQQQPRVDEAPPKTSDAKRVLGIIAWCFGALLWVPGSRYALDGWTLAINVILEVARTNMILPLATGVWSLLLLVVGCLYSIGEQKYIPVRIYRTKMGRRFVFLGWGVVLAWLLVNATDWGATYMGATVAKPDSWPVTIWMTKTLWASIVWATVLTYIPETLFILGARWIGLQIQWPWNRHKR